MNREMMDAPPRRGIPIPSSGLAKTQFSKQHPLPEAAKNLRQPTS